MIYLRLLASVIIFVSILFFPYWVYLPVLLISMVVFPFFWEAIVFGFLIDVFYGGGVRGLPAFVSPFALLALVLIFVLAPLQERLRLHV